MTSNPLFLAGAAGCVAFLLALALTPLAKRLSLAVGAVDVPDARKIHRKPMPRLGGLAVFLGVLGGLVALRLLVPQVFEGDRGTIPGTTPLLVGAAVVCLLGAIDDVVRLRASLKLLVQFGAAYIPVGYGFVVDQLTLPFIGEITLGVFAVPVTLIWIVGVTNAINLIDGLDGLATGTAMIAGFCSAAIALFVGATEVAVIFAAITGASIGFFFYNWNPARIFLGDSGAYALGYLLATASLMGSVKSATAVSVLVPILALGIPLADTAMAIVRRYAAMLLTRGGALAKLAGVTDAMVPDRDHIHHRLLKMGLTQKQAATMLFGVGGGLGLVAFLTATADDAKVATLLAYLVVVAVMGVRRLHSVRKTVRSPAGIVGQVVLAVGVEDEFELIREQMTQYGVALERFESAVPAPRTPTISATPTDFAVPHSTISGSVSVLPLPGPAAILWDSDNADPLTFPWEDLSRPVPVIFLTSQGNDFGITDTNTFGFFNKPINPAQVGMFLGSACRAAQYQSQARFSFGALWIFLALGPLLLLVFNSISRLS